VVGFLAFLVDKLIYQFSDVVVDISGCEYEYSSRLGRPEKRNLIYNSVDVIKEVDAACIPLKEDRINVLFVGRFDRQKGFDILYEAFQLYSNTLLSGLHLHAIGESVLGSAEYKSTPTTTIYPWMDRRQLFTFYKACDYLVMPSRWEGFGLVALESMGVGTPVVANKVGALPELIGSCGFVREMNSTLSIATVLNSISKADAEEKSSSCLLRVEEKFSFGQFQSKIMRLYLED